MAMHYSDPSRENDPHALPNVEVFHMSALDQAAAAIDGDDISWHDWCENVGHSPRNVAHMLTVRKRFAEEEFQDGWFWQTCFPGCLPDSEPYGPYETEAEALAAAREE